jgi:hypothetical protein
MPIFFPFPLHFSLDFLSFFAKILHNIRHRFPSPERGWGSTPKEAFLTVASEPRWMMGKQNLLNIFMGLP